MERNAQCVIEFRNKYIYILKRRNGARVRVFEFDLV